MARTKKQKQVDDYRHDGAKRLNNPPAALAREDLGEVPKRKFDYDPHLPPELWWAGKDHDAQLEVEAPSIHIHERLSAEAILKVAQREEPQLDLFGDPEFDRSKAIEFYEHEMDWVNRMILGDSLVVMTSLLERERLGGQVQMIYIDPPYGINFNSNFQARISGRSPKETADGSLTREPEQIQAYRDTWELGVHSYLDYLRSRLVAVRDLLRDEGSVFVQIGPDNLHLVRTLMDEVFGPDNACPLVTVQKTSGHESSLLPEVCDYLVWYAKDKAKATFRHLFERRTGIPTGYDHVELPSGERRRITPDEKRNPTLLPQNAKPLKYDNIHSDGTSRQFEFVFEGQAFTPRANVQWKIRKEGMDGLARGRRLAVQGKNLWYVRYADDFEAVRRVNIWTDTSSSFARRLFVVQTVPKIVERCMAMTTDPGDLVLDPTCGSGTTALAAERLGRRWITIDTSRVALAIARERILTSKFDYYRLRDESRGIDGGLEYEELTRVTASSIGYGTDPETETLYDQPKLDRSKVRVSGPFTVESLSRYSVDPLEGSDVSDASSEDAADHVEVLLDALKTQGIPRQNGKPAKVESLTSISGSGVLHAEGVCLAADGADKSFAVSLGPRHGPITPLQVDDALKEAPGYELIVFAGFAATSEAQEYLSAGKRGRYEVALLEANPDLLLGDLLKQTKSSQTFRLFSSPEAELRAQKDGTFTVELLGMDSFDTFTGDVTSCDRDQIAAWLLDTDYDASVFHANQAFFTREKAWEPLAKALNGSVDDDAIDKLHSFESLPFKRPDSGRVAIRVIDDAGSTSERVLEVPE